MGKFLHLLCVSVSQKTKAIHQAAPSLDIMFGSQCKLCNFTFALGLKDLGGEGEFSFCLCQQGIETCDEKVVVVVFDNVSLSIRSRGSSNQDLAARTSIGSSGTTISTAVPSSTTTATAGISSWELS